VPLLSFSTDEEAIEKANDTNFGLGASVWSTNIERATAMADQLEAGTVWVNTHYELDPRVPYGGFKDSGIGVEFGVAGLKAYCNSQTLFLKK
jgi:acyl-CoA reductase-like NAD-dependent aldehyde dehydrogenase